MNRAILTSAAVILLCACGQPQDASTAKEAISEGAGDFARAPASQDSSLPVPPAEGGPAAAPEMPANIADSAADRSDVDAPAASPATVIPAQYRGRWGMVPADCEPGRSDAKGLLTIGDKTIRFYESVGTLKERRPAIATSFAGVYDFSGEGMNWSKTIVFTRSGNTLTRAEDDQTYTYTRCAAVPR